MRLIFIGDIVGESGIKAIAHLLPDIKRKYRPQITIANGENVTEGRGLSEKHYKFLLSQGIDLITLGNHSFDQRQIFDYIHQAKCLIRPLNLPSCVPGVGYRTIQVNQTELTVINLLGSAFMNVGLDPFFMMEPLIQEIRNRTPLIFIDFHAESTSEKQAFAHWLDGQVSAVIGTHTHVQTRDAKILPKGTGYLTDVGMTGSDHSVIGFKIDPIVHRMTHHLSCRMEVANSGPLLLSAVFIEIDDQTGQAKKIEPIYQILRDQH